MEGFLRIDDIRKLLRLSRSTIFRLERSGRFPRRVRLSIRAIGWRTAEVETWITRRSEGGAPAPTIRRGKSKKARQRSKGAA